MPEIAASFVGLPLDRALAVIRVEAALQHEVSSAVIALAGQIAVLQSLEQFNMVNNKKLFTNLILYDIVYIITK